VRDKHSFGWLMQYSNYSNNRVPNIKVLNQNFQKLLLILKNYICCQ